MSVIDARGGRRVGTVALGGDVGNVQYDTASKRILANVQSRGEIATIDPVSLRVMSRTPIPGCRQNHGLLVDAARRLAFVACERNARLVVIDLSDGRAAASFAVGEDPDVLAFDTGRDGCT